jgi:Ca2+-binding EF-hand superfamily protein
MFPWIGAASSALSLLNTVLKSGTASGAAKTGDNLFSSLGQALTGNSSEPAKAVAGSGQGTPALSSGTLAALIAAQGQGGPDGKSAFARLDADGDGSISKGEFETAAKKAGVDTSSADALFGKLDTDGDGDISKGELAKAMHGGHGHRLADGSSATAPAGGASQASLFDKLIKMQAQAAGGSSSRAAASTTA